MLYQNMSFKCNFLLLKLITTLWFSQNCWAGVVNLARNKQVDITSYLAFPGSHAVDGNYSTVAHSIEGNNWMVIDLGDFYRVQYVKLINVKGFVGQSYRMNKFSVGLLSTYTSGSSPDVNDKCGTYPYDTADGGVYQLNCSQPFIKSRYVVLFSNHQDETVNVVEFEVHGDSSNSYVDRYMGCYRDFTPSTKKSNVTFLYECLGLCLGNRYAGISNGRDCYCGSSLGELVTSDNCKVPCYNDDHFCGSDGYTAVYNVSACPTNSDNSVCNRRNCAINSGQCGIHQCKVNTIGPAQISECVCKNGYSKEFYNDDCTDINECLNSPNPCNVTISSCKNTEGSYICNCSWGYKLDANNQCTDIDECVVKSYTCNEYNESCFNTIGSYKCICKDGFRINNITNICDLSMGLSNNSNTSAIIGGVLGCLLGILAILAVILIVYFCYIKTKKHEKSESLRSTVIQKSTNISATQQVIETNVNTDSTEVKVQDIGNYYNALTERGGVAAQFKATYY